jgi:hypothetical protein
MPTDNIIVYTVPSPAKGDLTGDVDVAPQEDLLVAHTHKDDLSGAVILQFRHALSRVSVKAVNLTDQPVHIHSLSLHNLCISGTLDIDRDVWKTSGNGIADINEDYIVPAATHADYKILWDTDGQPGKALAWQLAGSGVMVPKGGSTVQVTADDQSLLVLPPTTRNKNNDAIVDNGDFYLEVAYTVGNITETIQAPFADINNRAQTPGKDEGLTFEMGRQYALTLVFTAETLTFDVSVDDWGQTEIIPEVVPLGPDPDPAEEASYTPQPHKGFAGSNIYWVDDPTHPNKGYLTFDDVDVITHSQNQGLFFKWGSLVGIDPATSTEADIVVYTPEGANGNYINTKKISDLGGWTSIVAGDDTNFNLNPIPGVTDMRTNGYVTYLNSDPDNLAAYKGDICAYLSGRPGVPKGYWRLPTSAEFEPDTYDSKVPFVSPGRYQKVVGGTEEISTTAFTWSSTSDKTDGSYVIDNGYRLTYYSGKTVFFPAAGSRSTTGDLGNLGMADSAWSSSAVAASGHALNLNGMAVNPAYSSNRAYGLPVRCVKK